MIRQLKKFNVSRFRGMGFAFAAYQPVRGCRRDDTIAPLSVIRFPQRPDANVISAAIPLYYIAQNKGGFWLAREAEGRNGGLFLFKSLALRFAKRKSRPSGCATMVLDEPRELDVPNEGSRVIAAFAAAIDIVECRAPALVSGVRISAAAVRNLAARISRALASERTNRAAIERELFHGQYTLASKNDDDLPIL
jgi:hypothetical protein